MNYFWQQEGIDMSLNENPICNAYYPLKRLYSASNVKEKKKSEKCNLSAFLRNKQENNV